MKYFDEEKMAEIQKEFERVVLKWKGVVSRRMMGCMCYLYNRKFVCFLVTNGIVVMKLSDADQAKLKENLGGKPFVMAGQSGRMWETPLIEVADVKRVLPYVKRLYDDASKS